MKKSVGKSLLYNEELWSSGWLPLWVLQQLRVGKEGEVQLTPVSGSSIPVLDMKVRGAFDSAKNHKRQRRKRQSVTAQRENSQTPKFVRSSYTEKKTLLPQQNVLLIQPQHGDNFICYGDNWIVVVAI